MSTPSPSGMLLIPAFNEASRLGAVLERIDRQAIDCEVVVVDDGSADDTAGVARRGGATVLQHPFNLGYGAALQTGYKYALKRQARFVVQMDADGQHDPAAIADLIAPVTAGELDLVIGSRFLEDTGYVMPPAQRLGRAFFQAVARLLGLRVTDPTSGLQAMNRRALEVYEADAFPTDFPDIDVLLMAQRHALTIGERPVTMKPSSRRSTLHSGLRPLYYVYKMLLASFSARARTTSRAARGTEDR